MAAASQPWIRVEPTGAVWFDDQYLAASFGGLSGGERRMLCGMVKQRAHTGSVNGPRLSPQLYAATAAHQM